MTKGIDDVITFWEKNPLWVGESGFDPGTKEFFEEQRCVIIQDGFAGRLDERLFPSDAHKRKVLDLGCGPGFWAVELAQRGCKELIVADITRRAIELAAQRCTIYNAQAVFCLQNAEELTFESGTFSHVNCQGVIHHTPNTEACISEIARVLEPGGTASISVYHRGPLHKIWPLLRHLGSLLTRAGGGLRGRGRENIFLQSDVDEIVRLYDGIDNPIGKSFSRARFCEMLGPYFEIEKTFLHFFPARALPFSLPGWAHRFIDARLGFLIYAVLYKRSKQLHA